MTATTTNLLVPGSSEIRPVPQYVSAALLRTRFIFGPPKTNRRLGDCSSRFGNQVLILRSVLHASKAEWDEIYYYLTRINSIHALRI